MGSRANIKFVENPDAPAVYFYTHWSGHVIANILAEGLSRAESHGRINDPSYAMRIVFDTLVENAPDPGLGFGISVYPAGDCDWPTPEVRWPGGGGQPIVVYKGVEFDAYEFTQEYDAIECWH